MSASNRFIKTIVSFILVMFIVIGLVPSSTYSFGNQIITVGSRGGDVYELQGRLSYLGYYHGKIDGHFGWQTYNSVRTFQWKFGMKVDGVVGGKTKLKLWKATQKWRPGGTTSEKKMSGLVSAASFSDSEVMMLARAIHGEARGEPYTGKVAIAAVILNRVQSPLFPKSISGVIFQPGAFTAVDDGQIWLNPDKTANKAARDAINGWDPSGEAIYYFNPATATSKWIWSRPQIKQIGKHIFCK